MTTTITPSNAAAAVAAGVFSFDVRNTSTTKVTEPVYEVEDANIDGDNVDVDYFLNGQYARTVISFRTLKAFVVQNKLNAFCDDSSDHTGRHVQESGFLSADEFITEELNYCVEAYLVSIKAGQVNVN